MTENIVRVGRPKQFDEQEVLERAMNLFWLRGYASVGLAELLQTMGISRQSLYDTFGNKRGLFVRAIHHYRDTQLVNALALLDRPGSPRANVEAVVRFFEKLASDASCRGCFVANALVELGPHDAQIACLLRDTLELLQNGVQAALERAQAQGEIPPTKSPHQLSRALTNAMVGMAVTGKLPIPRSALREIYDGTLSMLD